MSTIGSASPQSDFYIPATASLAERRRWTLKQGDAFALFDHYGDIAAGGPEGLFYQDTRFLARSSLRIEGERPLLLSSMVQANNVALNVDLTNPDLIRDGEVLLTKDKVHLARALFLWDAACHELLVLRSFDTVPRTIRLALAFDADFADLFEVRGFKRTMRGKVSPSVRDSTLRFDYASLDGIARATEIRFAPAPMRLVPGRAEFELRLAPKARCSVFVTIGCLVDGAKETASVRARSFFSNLRRARHALARAEPGLLETSNGRVNEVIGRSLADTAMLITDTAHGPYPYAGIPWFSTVFGRDGIITAIQLLWLDPTLARGVLDVLAANQADRIDPTIDAQPGKILHEMRKGELAHLREIPFGRYYGSVDATPLFVVLAGLYWQRTGDRVTLERIWPNVKAALDWISRYGDLDDDGFIEYSGSASGKGLVNQGWKDSEDSIFHADGTLAEPPIALVEVQSYVYWAWQLAAELARDMGDSALASALLERARTLRVCFEQAFWCEDIGCYALALDGAKRPCRVRTSNAGQALLSGICDPQRAARVARLLFTPEMFNGWGIRTLHEAEARFNPASYHNGSVWPHDNALMALGLARYGRSEEVLRLTGDLFEAAFCVELRRLPELFCGFRRRRDKGPTSYPVACSPQAWAAATPLALLQACLNFSFDASHRTVRLAHPRLPRFLDWVKIRRLPVGEARVDLILERHGDSVAVDVLGREGQLEVSLVL
ncbi:MAG TPA: amylo-alpha-1,6-glucosidase [Burkholderiales bacterium]|nr:amylo-alpha-1,6-glucosidase [Burkholderiales bacterium]